jgi:transposase InsO family protein
VVFKPDTLLQWHRALIRRKWTLKRRRATGRPCIGTELETLIIQLANENPRWGYSKIHGELLKLGYSLGRSTVRNVLKRHKLLPAPQRTQRSSSWRTFPNHYHQQILACDFFTVETMWLKTIYVLFFIELGTRRVHLAGCTTNPTGAWVTQQARHLSWHIQDSALPKRFLIHDRDTKFPVAFDTVFAAEGVTIIHTPYQAPNANAFAERWIRSVREECLDHLLIVNETHLQRVLTAYVTYFNHSRPHQGLAQQTPVIPEPRPQLGRIHRRDVLGGILHDYYRAAA